MSWYTSGCGRIELQITKAQAAQGAHPGPCDTDIAELRKVPAIRRQLAKLNRDVVARELQEYGAWSTNELADHDENLSRLLWVACSDIREGYAR
jgi:hypothetical protein